MRPDHKLVAENIPQPAVGFVETFLAVNLKNIARPPHADLDHVVRGVRPDGERRDQRTPMPEGPRHAQCHERQGPGLEDALELGRRNLRVLREFHVELGPGLNVFVGANAQGKTSILDGICFAPLNKGALHQGGWKYHDEHQMFAALAGHKGFFGEMNVLDQWWMSRVTSHVSLRTAIDQIDGRVSAVLLTPYPPGIPLLIPGERFNKTIVDYLVAVRGPAGK